LIYTIKKKLQLLFKKLSYGLFKLIYGKIEQIEPAHNNEQTEIKFSKISPYNYKVFLVNQSRIYTDTINDTAIIQNNTLIEGPSFQIRETVFESIKKNIVLTKGTSRMKKKINGTLFSLLTGGAGNFNYWHWLFDVLPRFKILQNILELDKVDFFLLPNLDKKFQKESLDIIGIPFEKRISSLKNRHIECEKIIITDHPYVIRNNATQELLDLPQWIIAWLKETFTKNLSLEDSKFPKRIYIDRKDADPNIKVLRKILNEEEVVSKLKAKEFKIITLSDYSISDQIKLFYNANNIVGLHGAGFANIIFSKPHTSMLELKSSGAGKACENLAVKSNVNYDCLSVIPEKFSNNNQMGHIRINIEELENKIAD